MIKKTWDMVKDDEKVEVFDKIDELVDAVNDLQKEKVQRRLDILRKMQSELNNMQTKIIKQYEEQQEPEMKLWGVEFYRGDIVCVVASNAREIYDRYPKAIKSAWPVKVCGYRIKLEKIED